MLLYLVSLGWRYWVLNVGMISRLKAAVLLSGAVVYIVTVIYSPQLSMLFAHQVWLYDRTAEPDARPRRGRRHRR